MKWKRKEKKRNRRRNQREMKGGGNQGVSETGMEGTGLNLAANRLGNLTTASSDENLTNILLQIRSSKTPVSCFLLFSLIFYFLFSSLSLDDEKIGRNEKDDDRRICFLPAFLEYSPLFFSTPVFPWISDI